MCAGLCLQCAAPLEVLPEESEMSRRLVCKANQGTCREDDGHAQLHPARKAQENVRGVRRNVTHVQRIPLCVSKHTNKPAGNATYKSGPLKVSNRNASCTLISSGIVTMSSHVPDPTVNRRMSVNSGAARMGATTLCLHMCVLTRRREKQCVLQ